ncbi:endoplasmic reticulum-Golgi intermediate compartment protein 3-like isoform X1 [Falco peregrinus]|uniref:endoplasmic reticulum-Golgi intermediate compartment protein 3-like isoform X1 n=1 Tax=Falco peregrinus TaxID=8954 RepID=UPI00247AC334|nr:endoplasmic reticulum-Golgi intermediate compartment protein 3-like isoform X1 [Falco peregrinus]
MKDYCLLQVAGNFHFAPAKSFQQSHVHVHDLQSFGLDYINMMHYIKHLSFGRDYPGIVNPLDGTDVTAHQEASTSHSTLPCVIPFMMNLLRIRALAINCSAVFFDGGWIAMPLLWMEKVNPQDAEQATS